MAPYIRYALAQLVARYARKLDPRAWLGIGALLFLAACTTPNAFATIDATGDMTGMDGGTIEDALPPSDALTSPDLKPCTYPRNGVYAINTFVRTDGGQWVNGYPPGTGSIQDGKLINLTTNIPCDRTVLFDKATCTAACTSTISLRTELMTGNMIVFDGEGLWSHNGTTDYARFYGHNP